MFKLYLSSQNTTSTSIDLKGDLKPQQFEITGRDANNQAVYKLIGDNTEITGNEWSFGKVKAEVLLLPFLNLMVISFRHIILSMDHHRNFPISFNYKFGIKKAKDPL